MVSESKDDGMPPVAEHRRDCERCVYLGGYCTKHGLEFLQSLPPDMRQTGCEVLARAAVYGGKVKR